MNGRYLTPDTGCKSGYDGHEEGPPHCQINRAYAALLEALGSEDWVQLIRRRSL
jgi:hypothetical protein